MFNIVPFVGYVADKRFVANVYCVSQHSRKPLLCAFKLFFQVPVLFFFGVYNKWNKQSFNAHT